MERVRAADRLMASGTSLDFKRFYDDFPFKTIANWWDGLRGALDQVYVVQTNERIVQRCILMASDPGDLVLDPTCGSGTTAYVSEQWGRRWITIDTSRVALALARARLMGARYPFYLLADSAEGVEKESKLTGHAHLGRAVGNNIRRGFVCHRFPYVTSGLIANNAEIDTIVEKLDPEIQALLHELSKSIGKPVDEWDIPSLVQDSWSEKAKACHADLVRKFDARRSEIAISIAAKAEVEVIHDRPYQDRTKVRVAGPFTVESLSPHRALDVDENDDLIVRDEWSTSIAPTSADFYTVILENLISSGVQQANKEDKIEFSSLAPWPGDLIAAEGRYQEGADEAGPERRAAIFIGPEFGTVSRPDLVAAAREAGDADFDVLIACAFSYDAHSSDFAKLGRIPVLKAHMNADLHMADDLKNTGKGNLFVIFGEPDIDILPADGAPDRIQVKINGVDVFHPNTGEVRSDGAEGIACWFIDTDYNEESFFVRHAYFLGANDPYKSLKTTLKAEINEEAWESLHSDTSRPFAKPESGRIAVKVINHLGDEVMKVFRVD